MKKFVCKMLAVLLICGLLLGSVSCADSREKLYVYNWGLYIDESVVREFENQYNIKVIYDTFDNNETMYQYLTGSNVVYDVLIPSDYMISKMIQEDRLQKIDFSKIPNASFIMEEIMEKSKEFDPNNEYAIPYTWGTVGILYNKEQIKKPVDSWNILWDADYKNQIFMYDSQRDALAVALKKLGYSLNTTNDAELQAAVKELIQQKPLVKKYMGDEVLQSMKVNGAWLAVVYNGDAVEIMSENEQLDYAIPKEGTNLFIDSMVIPKNAQNVEAAHKFINFLCETEVALKNTQEIGYSTPHKGAFEQLDAETKEDPAYWPYEDVEANPDKYEVFHDLGAYIREYEKAWNEVIGN